ncbi:glycosyltransferase family 87 protein [Hyphomonas sp.]|uniref:glycosyltransferase family 87 protein n=1 Tax=Hyphomonas sp. TaxID=87 RepID=UPI00391A601E
MIDSPSARRPLAQLRTAMDQSPATVAAMAILAVLAAVLAAHLVLALTGQQSALWPLRDLLRGEVTDTKDSWSVMLMAHEWLRLNPGNDGELYQEIFFTGGHKFQYAPTSLLPVDLLAAFGLEPSIQLMNQVNRGVFLASLAGLSALVWLAVPRLSGGGSGADITRARLVLTLAAPVAGVVFFPLIFAYDVGQLQAWINGLFIAAAIAWLLDRPVAAGVLIGLVCLLKPQFGLFLFWGLLRREWRFAAALAITGTVGLALSVALYGFNSHLAYLEVLSFLSRHGESYIANQSANGMLHRLFGNGEVAEFESLGFPPFHAGVYAGTLIVTLGLLALLGFLRRREGCGRLMDFLLAALVFTAASPIAWEHHYGVLMPMFALLAAGWVGAAPGRAYWRAGAVAGAIFFTACLPLWAALAHHPALFLLQSNLYIAALALAALIWRLAQGQWRIVRPKFVRAA